MSVISYIIKPLEGCGELKFGQTIEEITALLGEAEEIDHLDTDDDMTTVVLHFWNLDLSIFFEGAERTVLACFETDHPDSELFGKKIFALTPKEITELMNANGYNDMESEEEEGELRLSFEDGLIDFFYDGDDLLAVNWGVYVDESGTIITD